MKSEVFYGKPEAVQQQLSDFLKERNIKIHGFAQSQSTTNTDLDHPEFVVTATIIYTEFDKTPKKVLGFGRED